MALRSWSSSAEPTAERTGADKAMGKAEAEFEYSSKAVKSDEMLSMLVTERCSCIRGPPCWCIFHRNLRFLFINEDSIEDSKAITKEIEIH